MKEMEFEVRLCQSGSSGISVYLPSHVTKTLDLKSHVNTKLQGILDEDGDIVIYTSDLSGDTDE